MIFDNATINTFTADDLLDRDLLDDLYEIDGEERERIKSLLKIRAKALGIEKEFASTLKAFDAADKQLENDHRRAIAKKNSVFPLETTSAGKILNTTDNYLQILRNDPEFDGLRFNEMTNRPEKMLDGVPAQWENADDAETRRYIEQKYHIHSAEKLKDAFEIALRENAYNPLRVLIDSFVWDGRSRIESFLHDWMKCDDTPYTREVSRLIFAGGVHRLYNPGCKFDDMPVLIGTKQGEGKSTLVRWLAIQDEFFTEVTQFDGAVAIEQLSGAWICEVSELLALTKTKEKEAVKSFLTRLKDEYRTPYSVRKSTFPRRCIFIGTTNKAEFLTDKTGNRRFYPVKVHQNGYYLFDREKQCKEYIKQCWAEARYLFERGELAPVANRSLIPEIRLQQEAATEDDYRVGMIGEYLEKVKLLEDKRVCLPELWERALNNELKFSKPTKADQDAIRQIMQSMPGWERGEKTASFRGYNGQRYWRYVGLPPGFEEVG